MRNVKFTPIYYISYIKYDICDLIFIKGVEKCLIRQIIQNMLGIVLLVVLLKKLLTYIKSNVENPLKTGNLVADYAAGQIKPIKAWNTGFNVGKYGFMAKQTYDETCKRKK